MLPWTVALIIWVGISPHWVIIAHIWFQIWVGENIVTLLCSLINWPEHCLLASLWSFIFYIFWKKDLNTASTPTSERGSGNSLKGANFEQAEFSLFISRVVRNTIPCCLSSKARKIVPDRLSNVFLIVSSKMVNLVPVSWLWQKKN